RDDKTVRRYEAGQDVPLSVVTALSEATGIPTEWFAFGTSLGVLTHFELVKRLEVRASGGGALARSEESEEPVAFRADWLRRLGVSPRNARTMFAHGDSMEPTIGDGDLLLVDQSIDHIVDHGIYIVVYQGMVLVKRVQMRRDGTLVLKSDNPRYDEEVVPHSEAHDIHVAGRVRWYGRTI
ncbi:MAG: helix-turn-helix transcriptional regulator, partial [Xanthobacteraceae bacterium]